MKKLKLVFNPIYFLLFLVLLVFEIFIARFFTQGFIRHTFGDYLVVLLLYCFLKSFLDYSYLTLAFHTLLTAFVIEFLQLTPFLETMGIASKKWALLLFGNSFSFTDLIAYSLGFLTILWIENMRIKRHSHNS